ncbi:ABC transporter ATP-binding protein [Rhodococcus sp. SJ-2]
MTAVQISGVTKTFGDVTALADIDFDVESGENIAILGPSGSGKSTLLRIIAGLEAVDTGEIRFGGVSQNGIPPEKRDVAIVFQSYALYPHLSSRENITLGLRHGKKLSRTDADARATDIATRMQVEHLLDRKPRQMSGGQRQRIALARALARRSNIVLLDEPLSGLDAQLHAALRVEIAGLLQSVGATGINVTHDQADAMAMASRIAVINKGRIEQLGTPDELYRQPQTLFVAGFVGTPPMNLFRVDPETRVSRFGPLLGGDDAITLGVRPERFHLGEGALHSSEIWRVDGRVVLIEPTGRERIVHVQCGDSVESFAILVGSENVPAIGEHLTAWCERSHVHVYSNLTEQRLGNAQERGIDIREPALAHS